MAIKQGSRFVLLGYFILWFLLVSFVLRLVFLVWQYDEVSWGITGILRVLLYGTFFDVGVVTFFSWGAVLYFCLFPNAWIGRIGDRVVVWLFTGLFVFLFSFVFLAEVTFWEEFRSRFNFIAVDYLIYTHEVLANIQESYPLPVLLGSVVIFTGLVLYFFVRRGVFRVTFSSRASVVQRLVLLVTAGGLTAFYCLCVSNVQAEWSSNRYLSEVSKSGVYSFFAAFRNNQMKYTEFYRSIPDERALAIVRSGLQEGNSHFSSEVYPLHRRVTNSVSGSGDVGSKNVVFILVESLSASFMKEFGQEASCTPFLDSLAQKSIFFSNLYATGTRTVRGMEAVTLCIPPTPGQSIVKRPDNGNLFTVSNVFASKGYVNNFFYGGDGYFDNMNAYFGGNGFTIYDRGRGSILSDRIATTRHLIGDKEVSFENAWGICDGDIFSKMLSVADGHYAKGEPFFNFVMTTSNHKPYSYPSGKVAIPSGTGRIGAVAYTDYALRELFATARTKPWYGDTVFVIIADHCASSAGKNEIDVANYHIPAFIVNMPEALNGKVSKQCSQIDLFPTLFALLGWNYESDFFGKNVLDRGFEERAFIATYRKLGLLKGERVLVLSDQKGASFYRWNAADNALSPIGMDGSFLEETIAWYQTADYLFTHRLLH